MLKAVLRVTLSHIDRTFGGLLAGGVAPMSATQYRAALKTQAKEDAIRKAAAKKHEARLDRQVGACFFCYTGLNYSRDREALQA
jgi:hypothetical protein